ncbi:hypothetical protein CEXT_391491 [Caerostris extrusa]|uniref:Uncharacterized protein n=1 Tax=Caerostris extrusa TaxID=172846 RepID=A0AAV4W0J6_CAEEX|nr:hypothetical protein CEXT_391491 [Caerostris extrusa]
MKFSKWDFFAISGNDNDERIVKSFRKDINRVNSFPVLALVRKSSDKFTRFETDFEKTGLWHFNLLKYVILSSSISKWQKMQFKNSKRVLINETPT